VATQARQVPQGRHARTGPNAPARGRHAAPASTAARTVPAVRAASRAKRAVTGSGKARESRTVTQRGNLGQAARAVTVRKGGQHALMAEFLVFLGIVSMRAIADYVPGSQGEATEGTTKGTVTPASGQLGPLPILAAGFVIFFILSFLAARGGTWARVAGLAGLIIDTALLMKSIPELEKVSGSFGTVRASAQAAQTVPTPSGQLPYDEQITGA